MAQKPLFTLHASGVAGQGTVTAYYPMAGNHNTNGIRAVRCPYRSRCTGSAQHIRQLAIVDNLTAGDLAQRLPYRPLKRGAGRFRRKMIYHAKITGKVVV